MALHLIVQALALYEEDSLSLFTSISQHDADERLKTAKRIASVLSVISWNSGRTRQATALCIIKESKCVTVSFG